MSKSKEYETFDRTMRESVQLGGAAKSLVRLPASVLSQSEQAA